MTAVNAYVGQPIARIEDPRLLRGQGQFVDDVRLAGMLHAAILRSSVAVAVVIAESSAIAEDALDLIELDIEALPPCVGGFEPVTAVRGSGNQPCLDLHGGTR
jgi:CO/xanthine dehydrogenase Mo-binding subunit